MFYTSSDGALFRSKHELNQHEKSLRPPIMRKKYIPKEPNQYKYETYRTRILSKNKSFELTYNEFLTLINNNCVYCGDTQINGGIDRIDSNLGYTIQNSAPCCKYCNIMKHTATQQEFLDRIAKIANHSL